MEGLLIGLIIAALISGYILITPLKPKNEK